MGDGLYLGKQVDPESGAPGARLELDPADLLTHGLIVGMTGSGKTGLAIVLLEELLRQGVPVIAIDPKGDLANLLLLFDGLDAASFEPWIDPEAARRDGKDVKAAAADTAADVEEGPRRAGASAPTDIAALKKAHDAVVFTPGLARGRAAERAAVARRARGALRLRRGGPARRDPGRSCRASSASCAWRPTRCSRRRPSSSPTSIERRWRAGKGLDLEGLIGAIADPPFDKIGALPLETAFPRKERQGLMMALNNLLASPSFEAWRRGRAARRRTACCAPPTGGRASRSSRPRTSRTRSGSS